MKSSEEFPEIVGRHSSHLSLTQDEFQGLLRLAARSYPYLIVLDQEAWLSIQKDEEANLALSPEEAQLLESIRRPTSGEARFPLFINGRAGSGKSNMLQYLMADYIEFAVRRNTELLSLYMTYSPELIKEARKTVIGLLTIHYERLVNEKLNYTKVNEILEKSFVVFHEFLLRLLPRDAQKRFPLEKRVRYPEFCQLWRAKFAHRPTARQVSVDLAWHTIRSYIKGMRTSLEDKLTPEEFAVFPMKRRTIIPQRYELIYENVWNGWYKKLCLENGYWDDQDLAASVLDSDIPQTSNYAAIFCDEAQDFTPVELDLIFQLSVFAKRFLRPEQLSMVPFVFAGDPLQTLNPTGIRWEAVQANFFERFCTVLDPRRRAKVRFNYKELNFNYRSNQSTIKLCNLIQLLRSVLFDDRNINPQKPWWIDHPVPIS